VVGYFKNFNLEHVARLCSADEDGTGEGVHATAVDGRKLLERHAAMDLSTRRFDTLEADSVASLDIEARRESAIPAGVGWLSGKNMAAHRTATTIWISTIACRGRAATPIAARAWRPYSPKTSTKRSEAPLMTFGESANPGMQFT
jgi:hypothetical protein